MAEREALQDLTAYFVDDDSIGHRLADLLRRRRGEVRNYGLVMANDDDMSHLVVDAELEQVDQSVTRNSNQASINNSNNNVGIDDKRLTIRSPASINGLQSASVKVPDMVHLSGQSSPSKDINGSQALRRMTLLRFASQNSARKMIMEKRKSVTEMNFAPNIYSTPICTGRSERFNDLYSAEKVQWNEKSNVAVPALASPLNGNQLNTENIPQNNGEIAADKSIIPSMDASALSPIPEQQIQNNDVVQRCTNSVFHVSMENISLQQHENIRVERCEKSTFHVSMENTPHSAKDKSNWCNGVMINGTDEKNSSSGIVAVEKETREPGNPPIALEIPHEDYIMIDVEADNDDERDRMSDCERENENERQNIEENDNERLNEEELRNEVVEKEIEENENENDDDRINEVASEDVRNEIPNEDGNDKQSENENAREINIEVIIVDEENDIEAENNEYEIENVDVNENENESESVNEKEHEPEIEASKAKLRIEEPPSFSSSDPSTSYDSILKNATRHHNESRSNSRKIRKNDVSEFLKMVEKSKPMNISKVYETSKYAVKIFASESPSQDKAGKGQGEVDIVEQLEENQEHQEQPDDNDDEQLDEDDDQEVEKDSSSKRTVNGFRYSKYESPLNLACRYQKDNRRRSRGLAGGMVTPSPNNRIINLVKEKDFHQERRKLLPLNKAPGTPLNGEKFADELDRMTYQEILDLRKRNSSHALQIKLKERNSIQESRKTKDSTPDKVESPLMNMGNCRKRSYHEIMNDSKRHNTPRVRIKRQKLEKTPLHMNQSHNKTRHSLGSRERQLKAMDDIEAENPATVQVDTEEFPLTKETDNNEEIPATTKRNDEGQRTSNASERWSNVIIPAPSEFEDTLQKRFEKMFDDLLQKDKSSEKPSLVSFKRKEVPTKNTKKHRRKKRATPQALVNYRNLINNVRHLKSRNRIHEKAKRSLYSSILCDSLDDGEPEEQEVLKKPYPVTGDDDEPKRSSTVGTHVTGSSTERVENEKEKSIREETDTVLPSQTTRKSLNRSRSRMESVTEDHQSEGHLNTESNDFMSLRVSSSTNDEVIVTEISPRQRNNSHNNKSILGGNKTPWKKDREVMESNAASPNRLMYADRIEEITTNALVGEREVRRSSNSGIRLTSGTEYENNDNNGRTNKAERKTKQRERNQHEERLNNSRNLQENVMEHEFKKPLRRPVVRSKPKNRKTENSINNYINGTMSIQMHRNSGIEAGEQTLENYIRQRSKLSISKDMHPINGAAEDEAGNNLRRSKRAHNIMPPVLNDYFCHLYTMVTTKRAKEMEKQISRKQLLTTVNNTRNTNSSTTVIRSSDSRRAEEMRPPKRRTGDDSSNQAELPKKRKKAEDSSLAGCQAGFFGESRTERRVEDYSAFGSSSSKERRVEGSYRAPSTKGREGENYETPRTPSSKARTEESYAKPKTPSSKAHREENYGTPKTPSSKARRQENYGTPKTPSSKERREENSGIAKTPSSKARKEENSGTPKTPSSKARREESREVSLSSKLRRDDGSSLSSSVSSKGNREGPSREEVLASSGAKSTKRRLSPDASSSQGEGQSYLTQEAFFSKGQSTEDNDVTHDATSARGRRRRRRQDNRLIQKVSSSKGRRKEDQSTQEVVSSSKGKKANGGLTQEEASMSKGRSGESTSTLNVSSSKGRKEEGSFIGRNIRTLRTRKARPLVQNAPHSNSRKGGKGPLVKATKKVVVVEEKEEKEDDVMPADEDQLSSEDEKAIDEQKSDEHQSTAEDDQASSDDDGDDDEKIVEVKEKKLRRKIAPSHKKNARKSSAETRPSTSSLKTNHSTKSKKQEWERTLDTFRRVLKLSCDEKVSKLTKALKSANHSKADGSADENTVKRGLRRTSSEEFLCDSPPSASVCTTYSSQPPSSCNNSESESELSDAPTMANGRRLPGKQRRLKYLQTVVEEEDMNENLEQQKKISTKAPVKRVPQTMKKISKNKINETKKKVSSKMVSETENVSVEKTNSEKPQTERRLRKRVDGKVVNNAVKHLELPPLRSMNHFNTVFDHFEKQRNLLVPKNGEQTKHSNNKLSKKHAESVKLSLNVVNKWVNSIFDRNRTLSFLKNNKIGNTEIEEMQYLHLEGIDYIFYNIEKNIGYLRFQPDQLKPKKCAKQFEMYAVIVLGNFRITINNNSSVLQQGDYIRINKGSFYEILNTNNSISILMILKTD